MPAQFLIASLGNPGPLKSTLHSAGHTLIESLRLALSYPPFSRDSLLSTGLYSRGPQYTLYQSPSFMNTSGPALSKAYKSWLRTLDIYERDSAKLVVLHDELESPLGKIKMKIGGSARGHNGLKSCMQSFTGTDFIRIGVGIGRPDSRDQAAVSTYVLRKMTVVEKEKISSAASQVEEILSKLAGD